jgi:hypothetical protein
MPEPEGLWSIANTILVGLTLGVLIWYTIETFKLRLAAQRQAEKTESILVTAQNQNDITTSLLTAAHLQNEIAVMPMFALYPDSDAIMLENVGSGPGFNLSIARVVCSETISLRFDLGSNVIKPNQKLRTIPYLRTNEHEFVLIKLGDLVRAMKLNVPNPFEIALHCVTLHRTEYEFIFQCATQDQPPIRCTYLGYRKIPADEPSSVQTAGVG